jgi:predicted aspartyl protease
VGKLLQCHAPPGVDSMTDRSGCGRIISGDMGIFRTTVGIESPAARGSVQYVHDVLVDTGAQLSWMPAAVLESMGVRREKPMRFRMANGAVLRRDVGYGIVHAGGGATVDEIVFGEANDTSLLGARSIEGLNLRVDVANKRFLSAGPIITVAMSPVAGSRALTRLWRGP